MLAIETPAIDTPRSRAIHPRAESQPLLRATAGWVVSGPEDADLVHRARAGEVEAFEMLVERYTKLAGGVAFSVTGDYHAAADVSQEAFIKAHRALNDLTNPERFAAWLRNIVRTSAIDWVRKARSRGIVADVEPDAEGLIDQGDDADPVASANRAEVREHVMAEVAALPEHYREVIVFKYLDGMSYEDIAEHTGLTVEAVESRLHRARGRLRKRFRNLLK